MQDNTLEHPPTAAAREQGKTAEDRAEDIAYTINHAVSCATTDVVIAPTISAAFGVNVGCMEPGHDHGAHDHHGHDHHAHDHAHPAKFSWKLYRNEALHYFKGEIIGDAAAVPLTILVQRFFPSVMEGVRRLVEPVAAPFFKRGAQHAAQKWGAAHGRAADAQDVVDRAEAMYRHEITHLPQAVVWNLFAFPIGVLGQKWGGHGTSTARIVRNKALGALISNGILLGGRALAPDTAETWDRWDSTHVILPATKAVGGLFGVDEKAVDRLARKQQPAAGWQARVEKDEIVSGASFPGRMS